MEGTLGAICAQPSLGVLAAYVERSAPAEFAVRSSVYRIVKERLRHGPSAEEPRMRSRIASTPAEEFGFEVKPHGVARSSF